MKSFLLLIPQRALLTLALLSSIEFCAVRADDGFYHKFGLDLGDAGRTDHWAIFTYGSGTSSLPFPALEVSSPGSQVNGDIALAGAYSSLSVSDFGSVSGNRWERKTSTESKTANAVIGGHLNRFDDSTATKAITALQKVSNNAAALTPTSVAPNITGSPTFSNNPFGGKYVMNLTDFTLNNQTLTLNGAAGSAFVINVSNNFSLDSGSKIVLTGGLTSSDVLFNVTGPGAISIGGGSLFNGTLLAYNSGTGGQRTVTISGTNTVVTGETIANKVVVSNGAKMTKPPKKSKGGHDDDDDD